jgi:mRNA-degrading endonuclease HigB of HigAB toxin-antitoxin module
MKVKVALFKMKIKELNKVVSVDELKDWAPYPGDLKNSFPRDVKKEISEENIYNLDWSGKKMIYLSAN